MLIELFKRITNNWILESSKKQSRQVEVRFLLCTTHKFNALSYSTAATVNCIRMECIELIPSHQPFSPSSCFAFKYFSVYLRNNNFSERKAQRTTGLLQNNNNNSIFNVNNCWNNILLDLNRIRIGIQLRFQIEQKIECYLFSLILFHFFFFLWSDSDTRILRSFWDFLRFCFGFPCIRLLMYKGNILFIIVSVAFADVRELEVVWDLIEFLWFLEWVWMRNMFFWYKEIGGKFRGYQGFVFLIEIII